MSHISLDDPVGRKKIDVKDMIKHIRSSPEQLLSSYRGNIETAERVAESLERPVSNILMVGMGSSGQACGIVENWFETFTDLPIRTLKYFKLPSYAGKDTLLVVVTKSGETSETIKAFKEGFSRGQQVVSICAGGVIRELSEQRGLPVLIVQDTPFSRTTTFGLVGALGVLLEKVLGVGDLSDWVDEAHREVVSLLGRIDEDILMETNPVKRWAHQMDGTVKFVLSSHSLRSVGRRFVQQLNENCKGGAYYSVLPEALHNYILHLQKAEKASATFIYGKEPRFIMKAIERLRIEISDKGNELVEIIGFGESEISQILTAMLMGDYLSYYLALLEGVDPSRIDLIEEMRANLRGHLIHSSSD